MHSLGQLYVCCWPEMLSRIRKMSSIDAASIIVRYNETFKKRPAFKDHPPVNNKTWNEYYMNERNLITVDESS